MAVKKRARRAAPKAPERLTEQVTVRLKPSTRAWLEAIAAKRPDLRGLGEAIREALEKLQR